MPLLLLNMLPLHTRCRKSMTLIPLPVQKSKSCAISLPPCPLNLISSSTSRVLLAALCTDVVESSSNPFVVGFDVEREKESRLSSLLDFDGTPSRSGLLEQLADDQFPRRAFTEVGQLYKLLEVDFRPLSFGESLSTIFAFLNEQDELKMYVDRLSAIAFHKLLQQLAVVYSTIEISQIGKLLAPLPVDSLKLQRDLADALRQKVVYGFVDHSSGVVTFVHLHPLICVCFFMR